MRKLFCIAGFLALLLFGSICQGQGGPGVQTVKNNSQYVNGGMANGHTVTPMGTYTLMTGQSAVKIETEIGNDQVVNGKVEFVQLTAYPKARAGTINPGNQWSVPSYTMLPGKKGDSFKIRATFWAMTPPPMGSGKELPVVDSAFVVIP